MTILFKRGWEILWFNRKTLLVLNGLYYGLILALMFYTMFDTPLQNNLLETSQSTYMTGALSLNHKSGLDGQAFSALSMKFMADLLGASYGEISLPSFIIPFAGVFLGLFRAALLGIVFSPLHPDISQIIIPHIPTLLIDGQACILSMLGAYLLGRAIFWPASTGQSGHWKAYVEGVRQMGTLYIFIIPILLISSCYGVIETLLLIG
jgi:hypothetical protein